MKSLTITFDFPTEELAETAVLELSDLYGYPRRVLIDDKSVENPESREAFCKRKLGEELRERIVPRIRAKAQAGLEEQIRAQTAETIVS